MWFLDSVVLVTKNQQSMPRVVYCFTQWSNLKIVLDVWLCSSQASPKVVRVLAHHSP